MAPRRCEIAARRSTQKRSSQQVVGFDDLLEVATNLRWTWQTRSRSLFARLDPAASPSALEWPRRLLLGLGRATVEERLASDPELAALATALRYARNGDAPSASIALDALKSLIDAFTC